MKVLGAQKFNLNDNFNPYTMLLNFQVNIYNLEILFEFMKNSKTNENTRSNYFSIIKFLFPLFSFQSFA